MNLSEQSLPLVYRVATLEDAPELTQLINIAFRPSEEGGGWTSEAPYLSGNRTSLEEVQNFIQQEKSAFLLACSAGQIIGCLFVDARKPMAYLGLMAVQPGFQGRGITSGFKAFLENYTGEHFGTRRFHTLVLSGRQEIIELCYRRGMHPSGRIFPYPEHLNIGNKKQQSLFMLELVRRSDYWPIKPMRLLLSRRPEWESEISRHFAASIHQITFADFNDENIHQYDMVIPLTIQAAMFLSARRHLLQHNRVPVPSIQALELCNDKLRLNLALVEAGFGRSIPRMGKELRYPYIVKKRIDEWGANSHVVRDAVDEQRLGDACVGPEYFCQLFIPGNVQFAAHILMVNGQILFSRCYRYTFAADLPIQGKDAVTRVEEIRCPYLVLFRAMLEKIGFEGLCCIDYKVIDNTPFVLEINPRFGASMSRGLKDMVDQVA